jgi:hypothetical protein
MDAILNKLKDPSTWASLSVVGALVGAAPGLVDAVGQCLAGGAAALAIILAGRKKG